MATGKIRINGARVFVNDRIDLQFNNVETLNNAKLTFDIYFNVDFMEFDEVVIDDKYYFLLVEYEKKALNKDKWRYVFYLVNPAIKLQNALLPNRSVEAGEETRVIFDRYIKMYLDNRYVMDDKLLAALNNVETTQKTWSKPTLFEVFNSLLEPVNAIITMTDFYTLSVIALDKRGDNIEGRLNIVDSTYKSDYLNNAPVFRTELQNAISNNYITETVVFTTEGEPILNDSNFALHLKYPVENILEITYGLFINTPVGTRFEDKSLMPYLVEKTAYDSYVASNSLGDISGDGFKRNKIWYKTGSNVLGGFDYDDRSWFPIININKPSYDYWGFPAIPINRGINEAIITVKYIAQMENITVDLTRDALSTENKIKYVNQDEPTIDMDGFAIKQRLELERSGDLTIKIWGDDEPPKLMDYYKEFNIYTVNVTIDDVKTTWMAEAKYNYSYNNLTTAINSEKKFTSIEPASKSFLSNHITKINFEFSEVKSAITPNNRKITDYMLFRKSIFDSYVLVSVDNNTFILTPLLEKYGNSMVLFFSFKDNYSAGLAFKAGSKTQYEVPYKIRFTNLGFVLYDSDIRQDIFDSFSKPISPGNNDRLISTIKELPALDVMEHENAFNYITNKENRYESLLLPRYKTDRETTAETFQFNLLSNENTIIWDEYFRDVAWSESRTTFNKYNYIIKVNRDPNRRYSKVDWNFGDGEIDPINNWIITDEGFEFNFTYYTGLVIISKFDNKPIMAYNGSSKKLYLVEAIVRPKKRYWYISDEFDIIVSYQLELDVKAGLIINSTFGTSLNARVGVGSLFINYPVLAIEPILDVKGALNNSYVKPNALNAIVGLDTSFIMAGVAVIDSNLIVGGLLSNSQVISHSLNGIVSINAIARPQEYKKGIVDATMIVSGELHNNVAKEVLLNGVTYINAIFSQNPTSITSSMLNVVGSLMQEQVQSYTLDGMVGTNVTNDIFEIQGFDSQSSLEVQGELLVNNVVGTMLSAGIVVDTIVDTIRYIVDEISANAVVKGSLDNSQVQSYTLDGMVGTNVIYDRDEAIGINANLNVNSTLSNSQVIGRDLIAGIMATSNVTSHKVLENAYEANLAVNADLVFTPARMFSLSGNVGSIAVVKNAIEINKTFNANLNVGGQLVNNGSYGKSLFGRISMSTTLLQDKEVKTNTPTIGFASCIQQGNARRAYLKITNEDSATVTIRNYGSVKDTLAPGETKDVYMTGFISTPFNLNYSITAQAVGKDESDARVGSQRINFCFV